MEDTVIDYIRTLPPKKIKQFAQYFKGWNLAEQDDPSGLYMVEDSKITDTDRKLLAMHIYMHARRTMSMDKLATQIEELTYS